MNPMRRLRVADTDVIRRIGDGSPLVLLHGIGSNAESWLKLIAALPPALDIVAWWAPGYGTSAPVPPANPTPADYATRLARVLDELNLHRVSVVGHSLGCLFAAAFALAHPARVAGLAFLSPALGYGTTPGAAPPPKVQARIDDLAALGPEAFAAKRAGGLVHDPTALPAVRAAMAQVTLAGYAQAAHALGAGDLLGVAPHLPPALVACGERDTITPPDQARALCNALRCSTLHIIPDCGHAMPQEKPDEIATLIAGLELHG
jgi:pimeloyl-ACP methyl ester carboxylesterase